MIVTHKIPYDRGETPGELRIGWASWDEGDLTERSIKFAYKDSSGKISRGSPELPFSVLMDMFQYAAEQGELHFGRGEHEQLGIGAASLEELSDEKRSLKSALLILQKLKADLPWADFGSVYDEIGKRYDAVKGAIEARR